MNLLGICGSIRRDSYNGKLLRHAAAVAGKLGEEMRIAGIGDLPLFNEDLEAGGRPAPVEKFRADLDWADAIVIATPEYNNSVPGVLKNAIDWGSRPPNCWGNKVAALMGATVGNFGTCLAQAHLRPILLILNTIVVPYPFVYVPKAQEAFGADGSLSNEHAAKNIEALLARLFEVTRALKAGK
jgi:chromate reductase, NAD(P)H dehydrogenase (quinone)